MAESTLSLSRTELRGEVGSYLGFGYDSSGWSVDQAAQIDRAVAAGLRKFMYPRIPSGYYEWSFMKANGTLSLAAADYDYDLPDDFGGIVGTGFSFAVADNKRSHIQTVSEAMIRQLREAGSYSGTPSLCAIRPKASTPTASEGQRFEAIFYPDPDGSYTLTYRYTLLPDALTSGLPYPLGGLPHSETIKTCCLAAAAEMFNDMADSHWHSLMAQQLEASVAHDRMNFGPRYHGYNSDQSDNYPRKRVPWRDSGFTHDGITP
jgi:hypothetical protein